MLNKLSKKDSLEAWLDYIEKLHPSEIELTLERVREVKDLANISPDFPIILVGGTNGKGSVSAFIESILHASDLKIGCYTSPHLLRFNERIRINKHEVDDKAIVTALDHIERSRRDIPLTYFEITTLAAVKCMNDEAVDIAILEVGLGGRLDAVNIFSPTISLITTVSLDHQAYLGDSVDKIGFEKSGIFRRNIPAIINHKNPIPSMISAANKINANLSLLGNDYNLVIHDKSLSYTSNDLSYSDLPLPQIKGIHQIVNLAGALRCIELLNSTIPISIKAIKKGISDASIRGRFEVLLNNPLVVVDVAHNPESANNLANNFMEAKLDGITTAIFSVFEDKDVLSIIQPFINVIDKWYIAELSSDRALSCEGIEEALKSVMPTVTVEKFPTVRHAYKEALKNAHDNDNILMFGSFLVISESIGET